MHDTGLAIQDWLYRTTHWNEKLDGGTDTTLNHRSNMELDLKSLFGLLVHSCAHWLRPPQSTLPSPRIWAHIRGRYWSVKIDDISLWPPALNPLAKENGRVAWNKSFLHFSFDEIDTKQPKIHRKIHARWILKISRKTKSNQKSPDFCQISVISKKKARLLGRKPFPRVWI